MSKKIPSLDLNFEVGSHWGGEDNWYTKSKRWANKQNPIIRHLALGFIEWLWKKWIDFKVKVEMKSIEKQVKHIGEIWDEEDERNRVESKVVETGVFGEEGWSISMSNPNIDRGTEESESSLGSAGDEK